MFLTLITVVIRALKTDPYYGSDQGFEEVFEMIEKGSADLLDYVRQLIDS
jgi:protein-tyrosine-phosphatase